MCQKITNFRFCYEIKAATELCCFEERNKNWLLPFEHCFIYSKSHKIARCVLVLTWTNSSAQPLVTEPNLTHRLWFRVYGSEFVLSTQDKEQLKGKKEEITKKTKSICIWELNLPQSNFWWNHFFAALGFWANKSEEAIEKKQVYLSRWREKKVVRLNHI